MYRIVSWFLVSIKNHCLTNQSEAILIILSNLLPMLGVLFFQWRAFPILLLYLIEEFVILWFDVFKIIQMERHKQSGILNQRSTLLLRYFIFSVMIIIVQLTVIMMIVSSASSFEQLLISIQNLYFYLSVLFLLISLTIYQTIDIKKSIESGGTKLKIHLFPFKLCILFIITFAVILASSFKLSLIIIIVLKTFIDLRTLLKTKLVT